MALQAYASTGIRSDHESSTAEEARAKAALGMLVQIREGSTARNLDAILPALAAGDLGDFWTLVTDDVFPTDLPHFMATSMGCCGVVAGGVSPAAAVRHTTLIPARHYGMLDCGAIAPGYRADLVVMADHVDFRPSLVLKNGRVVARDGAYLVDVALPRLDHANTIHVAPIDAAALHLRLSNEVCPVIRIVPDQLITLCERKAVRRENGWWAFDPECDVAVVASLERHAASGAIGLGLVSGFGLRRHGALGSSVAHDSHNLVVVGTNACDMLACIRAGRLGRRLCRRVVGRRTGEFAAGNRGTNLHRKRRRRMPAAGSRQRRGACPRLSAGGPVRYPFVPGFAGLPELRITDRGVFDVVRQTFVPL